MNFSAKLKNLVWPAVFTVGLISIAIFLAIFVPTAALLSLVLAVSSISTAILAGRE